MSGLSSSDGVTGLIAEAHCRASQGLLGFLGPRGFWEGFLSSSALSTATACCALTIAWRAGVCPNIGTEANLNANLGARVKGLDWLRDHQNLDGGWGDTTLSVSNISTTLLVWAAFGAEGCGHGRADWDSCIKRAEEYIVRVCGSTQPRDVANAVIARYGKDRTFSVPILTMCALAGRLGPEAGAWELVIPLPFELAALPQWLFAAVRMPVVSYALPALIAIGQARHAKLPPANPVLKRLRDALRPHTLELLARIQPTNGGFLEATPLTSFVAMSLGASGEGRSAAAQLALGFIGESQRADGSWPIDTNLSTWVTTLSIQALHRCGTGGFKISQEAAGRLRAWLLGQQAKTIHPYTGAAPGGWGWTDLPGGVPDADDTAGALVALAALGVADVDAADGSHASTSAGENGVRWLLGLQNSDGGMPTFCRGWGYLPFDRSSPDLTAHAMRAWLRWRLMVSPALGRKVLRAWERGCEYLLSNQNTDGSWSPLWFGNQHRPDEANPVYGTSRVLLALADHGAPMIDRAEAVARGCKFLESLQQVDGGWSSAPGGPATVEETALAVEALACVATSDLLNSAERERVRAAMVVPGARWLARRVEAGTWTEPSPIGFYFAKLWYYEALYPKIFTVAALGAACEALAPN